MSNLPADIANQAFDAAGIDTIVGDLQEGSRQAQVTLRAYSQCRKQLLRAARWDFARRQGPLLLLADATGNTPNVGTLVPPGQYIYEYAYPTDCAQVRFIPWSPFQNPGTPVGNIATPEVPLMTGGQPPVVGQRLRPARFIVSSDPNYVPDGASYETAGVSPQGRTVILCNVKNAQCIYTFDAIYPNLWDSLFRAAMVAYLASEIALPLAKDKKFGLQMQMHNIEIAKQKITQARLADGNEGVSTSDITVDWMRMRISGGYHTGYGGGGDWGGAGGWGDGDCTLGLANGSTF